MAPFGVTGQTAAAKEPLGLACGCGSNIDKFVQILRGHDPNTVACLAPWKLQTHLCRVNAASWGIAGLNCSAV